MTDASDEARECARCGDEVEVGLSSRDWCDSCEADPDGLLAKYGSPCGSCGAEVGEPCRDGCPAADAQESIDAEAEQLTPARQVYRVLYTLPFAGVMREVPEPTGDVDGWLLELVEWLRGYGEWTRGEVERLGHVERKAIGMQFQRDVLGRFLRDLMRDPD